MRIIHVVASGGNRAVIRGNERYVQSLAAAQQAQGFGVAVMTDAEGLLTEACEEQGIPVMLSAKVNSLEMGAVLQEAKTTKSNIRARLIRKFADFRPDIIHCHEEIPAVPAMAAGNDMDIPCVFTPHLPVDLPYFHLRAASKFATLCIWKNTISRLRERRIPQSELYYVPCGTKASSRIRPRVAFGKEPNLMVVGRISHEKGINSALLAMVELRRRRGRGCPTLDIYGGGPLLEYYKETASILGLNDIVKFHGIRSDIVDSCPESNILVMPSRSPTETGPLVVLEALSRGMPIVATRVGDVAEILPDQRYGRIVPKDSIMMLADAIDATLSDVADSRFDPGLLIERHRNLYTVEKMAEGIASVYSQILARSPSTTTISRSPS